MLKYTGIVVIILLLSVSTNGQQHDMPVLNIPVSLKKAEEPLANILNDISQKANVYFSYDASVVVSDRLVSIDVTNKPIIDVLNRLFDNSLFFFIEKENQIIISLAEGINSPPNENHNGPGKSEYITLTGQVVDSEKGNPLYYASVSVFNKPLGTVTNSEGEFILKIEDKFSSDPIVLSCLGYHQKMTTVNDLLNNEKILMHPSTIHIKEVKVKAVTPEEVLNRVLDKMSDNYGTELLMMRAFYRETLKQDAEYINISEAVIDILKAQYYNTSREDRIRILKGRKSPEVSPFKWVNFKLMGGPLTMTKLDVLKTMDSFINPEFRDLYKYNINRVIWYHGHPVFVLQFKPVKNVSFPFYTGELYIDRETYALLHAEFGFSKQGLKIAGQSLIRKKPKGFKVKPVSVKYSVDYRYSNRICYFNSAKAEILFKVRNRNENINSQFNSISEVLITDFEKSQVKRFPRKEVFSESDIFTENINSFDQKFWGNFNILKPDEELQSAIENLKNINQSIELNNTDNYYLTEKEAKE